MNFKEIAEGATFILGDKPPLKFKSALYIKVSARQAIVAYPNYINGKFDSYSFFGNKFKINPKQPVIFKKITKLKDN